MKKLVLVIVGLLLISGVEGLTYISLKDGNWNDSSVWNGTPGINDEVIIDTNHNITLKEDTEINIVEVRGTLNIIDSNISGSGWYFWSTNDAYLNLNNVTFSHYGGSNTKSISGNVKIYDLKVYSDSFGKVYFNGFKPNSVMDGYEYGYLTYLYNMKENTTLIDIKSRQYNVLNINNTIIKNIMSGSVGWNSILLRGDNSFIIRDSTIGNGKGVLNSAGHAIIYGENVTTGEIQFYTNVTKRIRYNFEDSNVLINIPYYFNSTTEDSYILSKRNNRTNELWLTGKEMKASKLGYSIELTDDLILNYGNLTIEQPTTSNTTMIINGSVNVFNTYFETTINNTHFRMIGSGNITHFENSSLIRPVKITTKEKFDLYLYYESNDVSNVNYTRVKLINETGGIVGESNGLYAYGKDLQGGIYSLWIKPLPVVPNSRGASRGGGGGSGIKIIPKTIEEPVNKQSVDHNYISPPKAPPKSNTSVSIMDTMNFPKEPEGEWKPFMWWILVGIIFAVTAVVIVTRKSVTE